MWHVKDVGDVILIFYECNAIYVEDVKEVLESWDLGLSKYTVKSYVCWSILKMWNIIFNIFNRL